MDFSDFKKPLVLWSFVLSVVAAGIASATLAWSIADGRENRQDEAIKEKFAELSGNVDKQLASIRSDMNGQLGALGLSVQGLKANVLLLCGQRRPLSTTCDVKALVAEVRKASQLQAQFLDTADVKLTAGIEPVVATEGLKAQLPTFVRSVSDNDPAKADKPAIANAILWSSAADSAQWRQVGTTLVVVFANGTASFALSQPTTKEHVGELVQSLNTTTEALKAVGGVAQEKK
jgi:hypothetical protein